MTTFPGVVTISFSYSDERGRQNGSGGRSPTFSCCCSNDERYDVGGRERESNVFFVGNNFVYFRHRHLQLKETDCNCISFCKEPDQISRQEKKRKEKKNEN